MMPKYWYIQFCIRFRCYITLDESFDLLIFIISAYGCARTLYVIKFVSDLPQVSGFLRGLRYPTQIKLTTTI